MATDFNKNTIQSTGGFVPVSTNTPLDRRTVVATEADIMSIPNAFIGMVVYVEDTKKRFEITALKPKKSGFATIPNALVDAYIEYNPIKDMGYASEQFVADSIDAIVFPEGYDDQELREMIAGKADKDEIPSIEGLASEQFVADQIAAIEFPEVEEYDDAELREMIAGKANIEDIPSIEGLASEEFVAEKVAEIVDAAPEALDTLQELANALGGDENFAATVAEQIGAKADAVEVEERFAVLEAIDHDAFLTEHQDIDHLAVKADVDAMFAAQQRYEISNCPEGTVVDYREKEIRIMCPADAEFKLQQVGEGGNANMYYMTFTTYFPAEAVSFKEGDKGVIVDELGNFETTTGTGVDEHGRKFKHHWFALAAFDGAKWNYYGKGSTVDKYIGWTYCVEWYDKDGVVIGNDCIRINLSNEDCHMNSMPAFNGKSLANKTYVDEKIAGIEIPEVNLEAYAKKDDVDAALELKADKADIPVVDVDKAYVDEQIANIKEYDDTELVGRVEALEAVDHDQFITEHQDVSHLAVKSDVDAALELKADRSDIPAVDVDKAYVDGQISIIDEKLANIKEYDDTMLSNRVESLEAIEHNMFLTEHQDISHLATKAEIPAQPNFTYEVKMVDADQPAGFVVTGEFPNLVITLNLPMCYATPPDLSDTPMYFGFIPFDEEAYLAETAGTKGFTTAEEIGPDMDMRVIQFGIDNKSLAIMDAQALGRIRVSDYIEQTGIPAAAFLCVLAPKAAKITAYLDNGIGEKLTFASRDSDDGSTGFLYCQDGTTLNNKINGVDYVVYGAYTAQEGQYYIHIEQEV